MNAIAQLLSKVPQPVYNAAFNWFLALAKGIVSGKSPAESVKSAEAYAASLEAVQKVYDARAVEKFPGFKP